ncbi:sensor histidine kinase [Azospirillum sp. ST 5-10]|uniref:sensor histidine kinase n=1 Tax=unclassified Azospirillum TaxID=2630922 RepID=UPI003F4A28B6
MVLLTLATVIVVSYATLVGGALWREHQRTSAQAERNALNATRLLAHLLAAAVEDIDHELAEWGVATNRAAPGLAPEALVAAVAVVDGRGRIVNGSSDLAAAEATSPRRPAGGDGLTITGLARTGSGTLLVFRRALPEPGGTILGGVPPAALRRLFAPLDLDRGSRIGVLLADGTPVFRMSRSMAAVEAPPAEADEFLPPAAVTDDGVVVDRVSGGIPVMVAFAAVPNAPAVVALATPWSTVLAGWRETALNAAIAGAAIAVVVPALLAILFLWMRRVQAAEEARRAAEAASHAKSDFLALMSHELRTPLNTVLGFAEMIRDRAWGPRAEDRYIEYAADIHAAGTHLLSVLNDVLDLAKIEAGRMTLHPEPLDPQGLATACLRLCAGQARSSGVALTAEVPPGTAPLHGDARALRQIVVNLVSNACKFTPRGGSVRLAVADHPDGGSVITVADTGVGMTPDGITKALQRFGQVENRFTRTQVGTGLGLPLAKGLVELHGGSLSIDSAPGQGTTVTLLFPGAR